MSRTRIPFARQAPVSKPPVDWQDATAKTIARIQQVFALHPWKETADKHGNRSRIEGLTEHSKIRLLELASGIVAAQGRVSHATEYWNTFVNTLRMLVAGMSDCEPADAFDK